MKKAKDKGFTLLEILLAVTILGVVVSISTVALNSSVKLAEISQQGKNTGRQARVALQRMVEDLSSAVAGEQGVFEGENGETGDSVYLAFTSTVSVNFNPEVKDRGRTIIRYRVIGKDSESDMYQLVRFESPVSSDNSSRNDGGFIICDDLKSVELIFQDSSGQEFDSWRQPEEAGEGNGLVLLPSAVFIRIEFWLDKDKGTTLSYQTATWLPTAFFSGNENV